MGVEREIEISKNSSILCLTNLKFGFKSVKTKYDMRVDILT